MIVPSLGEQQCFWSHGEAAATNYLFNVLLASFNVQHNKTMAFEEAKMQQAKKDEL